MAGHITAAGRRAWLLAAIMAVFSVAAFACGDDDPTATATQSSAGQQATATSTSTGNNPTATATTPSGSEDLSGEILIDGSSTVFPITQAVAEEFRNSGNPGVQIVVGVSGTGGGFRRFVIGETAISNASRPISDSEKEQATANGIEFIELRVALDGLSVVVNTDVDFVDCLTVEELKKIWEPGSTINNWSQVREGFPDVDLTLYGPGSDSGTFDYFTDAINGEEGATRTDYTPSEEDTFLVQGVSRTPGAMGYFGFSYYIENDSILKALAVDSGNGCVTPSSETINDGSYAPLSRPIFIYVNKAALDRPEVKAFVEFYMQEGGALAEEVGYVALPDSAYVENLDLIGS